MTKDYYLSILPDFRRQGFHGDRIYQRLIDELMNAGPISSFVETGTFLGSSAGYVASKHRAVDVRSCEVDRAFYRRARRRLRRYPNASLVLDSSERLLASFLQAPPSDLTLFFLDAHWYEYWPLQDELRAISGSGLPAVIIVDDFQVPGRTDFGFDAWMIGLGTCPTAPVEACGVELVRAALSHRNDYRWLFPDYDEDDAFGGRRGKSGMRGHAVVFQNVADLFDRIMRVPFFTTFYRQGVVHRVPDGALPGVSGGRPNQADSPARGAAGC